MKNKTHIAIECDICHRDYSGNVMCGGFLMATKLVCPECAPRILSKLKHFKETSIIKAVCGRTVSFKNFALSIKRSQGN